MTHPFHPLVSRDFEFVAYRQNWGEDRVHLRDEDGQLFSLPAGWTDVAVPDPFVVVAAGRCPFTVDGLLAVADLVDRFRARQDGDGNVKASCGWIRPRLPGMCRRRHVSPRMRDDLIAALQARWEKSLRERASIDPRSPVLLLDNLLAPFRAGQRTISQIPPRTATAPILSVG